MIWLINKVKLWKFLIGNILVGWTVITAHCGICSARSDVFRFKVRRFFSDNFKPEHKLDYSYWYGRPCTRNVPYRLAILNRFKALVLSTGEYKKW